MWKLRNSWSSTRCSNKNNKNKNNKNKNKNNKNNNNNNSSSSTRCKCNSSNSCKCKCNSTFNSRTSWGRHRDPATVQANSASVSKFDAVVGDVSAATATASNANASWIQSRRRGCGSHVCFSLNGAPPPTSIHSNAGMGMFPYFQQNQEYVNSFVQALASAVEEAPDDNVRTPTSAASLCATAAGPTVRKHICGASEVGQHCCQQYQRCRQQRQHRLNLCRAKKLAIARFLKKQGA